MAEIELDLGEFSRDELERLIILSVEENKPVNQIIVDALESIVKNPPEKKDERVLLND